MSAEYGTAGYLATPHPGDEHVLVRDLWVNVFFCRRCGAIVHDQTAHDKFHHLFGKS